jgi:hypothetical protein
MEAAVAACPAEVISQVRGARAAVSV